jgi:hypothetical protein
VSVQCTLYVLAIVLALGVLVIVVGFGAIVVLVYSGRRSSFSYFVGGMTTKILDEDDIARHRLSIL